MLREKAALGARWTATSTVVVAAAQLLQTMILARILPPSDFGLMAMGMIFVNLAQIPSAIGLSRAVIQRKEITDDELSSLYWTSWLIGIGTAGGMVAIAPLVARFFNEPLAQHYARLRITGLDEEVYGDEPIYYLYPEYSEANAGDKWEESWYVKEGDGTAGLLHDFKFRHEPGAYAMRNAWLIKALRLAFFVTPVATMLLCWALFTRQQD